MSPGFKNAQGVEAIHLISNHEFSIVCGPRTAFATDCGMAAEEQGIEKLPTFLAPGVAGEMPMSGCVFAGTTKRRWSETRNEPAGETGGEPTDAGDCRAHGESSG